MEIQITTESLQEHKEVEAIVRSSILNYEEWEDGEEKLKYKLGHLVSDNVTIIFDNN